MTSPTSAGAALDAARSRVVDLLSWHFAHDGIPVQELDRRLAAAYRASSVAELEELVQDVPNGTAAALRNPGTGATGYDDRHESFAAEKSERILAVMSQTRRGGLWTVPRRLEVVSVMSETVLDLRQASLLPGVTDISVGGLMTQLTIIIPYGVRVVNRLFPFMASARDHTSDELEPADGTTVVRVGGWAVMTEVVIRR